MTEAIVAVAAAPVFEATAAPYAILDRQLKIRAVNRAYEAATGHLRSDLLGEEMFVAFPDNPNDPHADGVRRLSASLHHVFTRGTRHYMGVQRYDVRDTDTAGRFRYKVWTPVNSPIRDEAGRCAAVLHHVEDVTDLFAGDADSAPAARPAARAWRELAGALKREREVAAELRQQLATLREAVESNRMIGSAVGLLMAEAGVGPDEAFEMLRDQSARQHRKMREIAQDLIADRSPS
ncbi:MAG TPA: ANTAR domain-containing protein [Mycobacteriales bacterium]|nr:ANTAR domain-containing protein [Mycobacteriales bacterium]